MFWVFNEYNNIDVDLELDEQARKIMISVNLAYYFQAANEFMKTFKNTDKIHDPSLNKTFSLTMEHPPYVNANEVSTERVGNLFVVKIEKRVSFGKRKL